MCGCVGSGGSLYLGGCNECLFATNDNSHSFESHEDARWKPESFDGFSKNYTHDGATSHAHDDDDDATHDDATHDDATHNTTRNDATHNTTINTHNDGGGQANADKNGGSFGTLGDRLAKRKFDSIVKVVMFARIYFLD